MVKKIMDREKVKKKREEWKKQRSLDERLSLISDLVEYLESKNISYKIRYDNYATDWIEKSFPILFSSIDWDKVINGKKVSYSTDEQRDKLISEAVAKTLKDNEIVMVIWSNGLCPEIEVTAKTIMEHTEVFSNVDFDFWVVNIEKSFVLKIIMMVMLVGQFYHNNTMNLLMKRLGDEGVNFKNEYYIA